MFSGFYNIGLKFFWKYKDKICYSTGCYLRDEFAKCIVADSLVAFLLLLLLPLVSFATNSLNKKDFQFTFFVAVSKK